jgi:hypothetical protein
MGCGKFKRIRTKKVGKEKALRIGVRRKKGKRGGYSEAIGEPFELKRERSLR